MRGAESAPAHAEVRRQLNRCLKAAKALEGQELSEDIIG